MPTRFNLAIDRKLADAPGWEISPQLLRIRRQGDRMANAGTNVAPIVFTR
jgi:hypothetical protein